MSEGTKIPNPVSRIVEMLADGGKDKGLDETLMNIGKAMAAAGVTFGGVPEALALGSLAVDARLPNLTAGAEIGGIA